MSCRCTNKKCQAYAGDCDCRFDGKQQGADDARASIVAWIRLHATDPGWRDEIISEIGWHDLADDIEQRADEEKSE